VIVDQTCGQIKKKENHFFPASFARRSSELQLPPSAPIIYSIHTHSVSSRGGETIYSSFLAEAEALALTELKLLE
jgi:hypothetical protein